MEHQTSIVTCAAELHIRFRDAEFSVSWRRVIRDIKRQRFDDGSNGGATGLSGGGRLAVADDDCTSHAVDRPADGRLVSGPSRQQCRSDTSC